MLFSSPVTLILILCLYLGRLDLWLPLRFSDVNGLLKIKFNGYYNSALKYLHLALDSTSVASAALLPLIQVWSILSLVFRIDSCSINYYNKLVVTYPHPQNKKKKINFDFSISVKLF
jgi:hypothetical protein